MPPPQGATSTIYVNPGDNYGWVGGIVGDDSNGTIQNCVALNQSVTLLAGVNIGRAAGTTSAGYTLQNNYAWAA